MLLSYKRGQGSIVIRCKIRDSSVSTGAGKTGLTHSSSGLIISTIANNEATATAYTQAANNIETISTLGTFAAPTSGKCRFKEVDSTNHKGVYEIQIADTRFAVPDAKAILISISGVADTAECDFLIPLTDIDPYDPVRAGLTALPNANAAANGGLPTVDGSNRIVGIQGTVNTFDALNTSLSSTHGAGSWATATGFSTHSASDVWAAATRTLTAFAFTVDTNPNATETAIEEDTQDIQNRLPAALSGGRIDAHIGSMASNVLTAAAFAADAANEIATAIESEFANDATGEDLKQQIADKIIENLPDIDDLSLTAISAAVWDRLTSALSVTGSIGKLLVDMIDAAISSRLAPTDAGRTLDITPTGTAGIDWSNIENQSTAVNLSNTTTRQIATVTGNVNGSVGSVTGGINTGSGSIQTLDVLKSNIDVSINIVSNAVDEVKTVTTKLDSTLVQDGLVWQFTVNALELGPSGGGGGDATLANQTTIIEHLEGIKGPTWDSSTDSLEEIADSIALLNVGSGTGANTVTITVNDGATALEGARVRLTQGAESYLAITNVSGQAIFSLDNATWQVSITKSGYQFTPTSLIVNGDETQTYSMSLVSIPSSNPGLITGYYEVYDEEGELEIGAIVNLKMILPPTASGYAFDSAIKQATSNGSGIASFPNLFPGATYTAWRSDTRQGAIQTKIPLLATSPYPLNSLIGDS